MKSIFGILSLIAIFTLTVTETVKANVETTVIELGIHSPVPVLVDFVAPSVTVIEIDSVTTILDAPSVTSLSRNVKVDKVATLVEPEPEPLERKDLSYTIEIEPTTFETTHDTGGVIDNIVGGIHKS
jgi:hypothetical protein